MCIPIQIAKEEARGWEFLHFFFGVLFCFPLYGISLSYCLVKAANVITHFLFLLLNSNKICNHLHLWQGKQKKKKKGKFFWEQNSVKISWTIFLKNVTIRCCIRWQEAKICFRTHSPRTRATVSCFRANYFKHRLFDTVSSFCPEKRRLYLFHFLIQSSAHYYFCCPFYEIIFTENY